MHNIGRSLPVLAVELATVSEPETAVQSLETVATCATTSSEMHAVLRYALAHSYWWLAAVVFKCVLSGRCLALN